MGVPSPTPNRGGNDQPEQGEDGDRREGQDCPLPVKPEMLLRAHDALLAVRATETATCCSSPFPTPRVEGRHSQGTADARRVVQNAGLATLIRDTQKTPPRRRPETRANLHIALSPVACANGAVASRVYSHSDHGCREARSCKDIQPRRVCAHALGRPIQKYPCGVLPAECPVAVESCKARWPQKPQLGECGALFPVLHPCG